MTVALKLPFSGRTRCLKPCRAVVGVDLGTSNSAVAILAGGKPRALEIRGDQVTVPSEVICTKTGLVAHFEVDGIAEPSQVISGAKRFLGKEINLVKEEIARCNIEVAEGSNKEVLFYCKEANSFVSPEQVITIPAYFTSGQKVATLAAAGMADVHQVALLQEPIAAALAYGIHKSEEYELALVIDVGGGTFDVSIVSLFDGILEVIAFSGDQNLGGRDFDHRIFLWLLDQLDIKEIDSRTRKVLEKEAERAKIDVIANGETEIEFEGRTVHLSIDHFDRLTHDLSLRFLQPIIDAGKEAMIDWINEESNSKVGQKDRFLPPPKRITQVVLAGGSSPLPSLHSLITSLTGIKSFKSDIDPKLCVAYGAAIYAGMLEGSVGAIEIMDGAYSKDVHERSTGFVSF